VPAALGGLGRCGARGEGREQLLTFARKTGTEHKPSMSIVSPGRHWTFSGKYFPEDHELQTRP